MSEQLHIPDEAYSAGEAALRGYPLAEADMLDAASEVLQAAAPAIVAAELRRLAALLDETDDVRKLLARADDLDGGAS